MDNFLEETELENVEYKKKLNWGDSYKRKDKSKFNDKLWESEKGTRKIDDEFIQINLHPMNKIESSADLLQREEFLNKEVLFNTLIQNIEFFKPYIEVKNLKKLEQNECWSEIMLLEDFDFLDISEKFMLFTEYFKLKPEKFYDNLDIDNKNKILQFLKK